jgi:hypothetical protein
MINKMALKVNPEQSQHLCWVVQGLTLSGLIRTILKRILAPPNGSILL